ncbi:C6 transcription factor [Colletotrichum tofieldiae]|uniref:C6 transcription factor n=1 Tax=Colletotrichum tofieldiae TaxID=708197 RepID=A0A166Z544_9PEZI|nr:C6 transcription factor [Colletotrichum tofieldiae]
MNKRRLDRHSTGDDELNRTPTPRRRKRTRVDPDGSDDAATHTKVRMRVTRACNQCRKRKDRCDGGRPSCGSCVDTGRTCNYNPPKKRGLRTGYVRAIEVILGMMLSTIKDSDSWMAALMKGQGQKPSFRLRDWRSEMAPDTDVAEFLVDAWRKSDVLGQVEQWLSNVESVEGDEVGDSSRTFDSGVNTAMKLTASILDKQDPPGDATSNTTSPNNTNTTFPTQLHNHHGVTETPPSFTHQETESIFADHVSPNTARSYCPDDGMEIQLGQTPSHSDKPLLPENWTLLLDIYFANTHSWLPLVQKHEILRLAYMVANDSGGSDIPEGMSKSDLAFLWAILACASQHDENQRVRDSVEAFRVRAANLLAENLEQHDIGHVRTFLVLTILQLHCGNRSNAWLAVGQATYAATTILFSDTPEDSHRQIDEGTKRTLLCCFVLDTLIASWVNSRPYFQRADLTKIGMLSTDSTEEWEPWQSKDNQGRAFIPRHTPGHILSTFNHFVQLVAFINDLITLHNDDKRVERLQELSTSLQTWSQNNILASQNWHDGQVTPQNLNLRLARASIFETFRTEKLRYLLSRQELVGGSSFANMQEQGRLLSQRLQIMGACCIPPTCGIYFYSFDKSLDYHIRLQDNLGTTEDLQILRTTLSKVNRTQFQARMFLNDSQNQNPKTTSSSRTIEGLDTDSQPGIWSPARDITMSTATLVGSGPSARPEAVNTRSNLHCSDYLQQTEICHGVASELLLNPDATPGRLLRASLSQACDFDQVMNTSMGEVDDDELFQSLANLDSADWSVNPPEFMEHLGVLRDATSDLQCFFDEEPG